MIRRLIRNQIHVSNFLSLHLLTQKEGVHYPPSFDKYYPTILHEIIQLWCLTSETNVDKW